MFVICTKNQPLEIPLFSCYANIYITNHPKLPHFTVTYQAPFKKRLIDLCVFCYFAQNKSGQVFENPVDYENHQLQGYHLSFSNISTIDIPKTLKYWVGVQWVSLTSWEEDASL